jgi:hypothetical protein
MSKVAFVHRTYVPQEMGKNFIRDWWLVTKHYGAPDATLHRRLDHPSCCDFIQLVIWPNIEEAVYFFEETLVNNEIVHRLIETYLPYTKTRQQVSLEELLRYRSNLPMRLREIKK